MSDFIDICNQAIIEVGGDPISSFDNDDEATVESVACSRLYHPTKRALLRSYPWNCATKRQLLAPLAAAPVNEFGYQFTLPTDCIKVFNVYTGDDEVQRKEIKSTAYQIEGRNILTNYESIIVRYGYNVDEEKMDPHLEWALAGVLAGRLAYPLTGSNTTQTNFINIGMGRVEEAKITDNLEQPHKRMRVQRLQDVRAG